MLRVVPLLMLVSTGGFLLSGASRAADSVEHATVLDHTSVTYLSHCGGCHGIEGVSGSSFVPTLRNAVGGFACTEEGRAYLIRVPGVSMSLIRDDQTLADVMNFVMFRLAGTSLPAGFRPYTAAEIHQWRREPLSVPDFMAQRGQTLGRSLAACAQKTAKKL
ncbi:c-type cytochrome [Acetobacter sp.]|uniref:c-type cytochrome n=1 Tax=Acetobacter sp. TaxID=440 RepID=UPI0025C1533D|nr:cystathionine beta-lyase [Acetobacter sp.]MCH4089871.1 cytochrome c [Acetobacter sp.]MCI1298567.1 cytochrome c [Acetobacter sp.]MCI1315132.1 cytochrome c [Acetobacter sp.]